MMRGKPLEDSFENSMLLFNEVMVSIYLYVLISLTDHNDDADLFENCGIALLSIVMISFAVNFIKFLFFLLREIYRRIKKACCRDPPKKSDKTVSIKPTKSKDEYQSDITLDEFNMRSNPVKRGPNV